MIKKLKVPVTIRCGESDCIDSKKGEMCDYLYGNSISRYCSLFDNQALKLAKDGNIARCKKCLEAGK
jgi:hypothetical protein